MDISQKYRIPRIQFTELKKVNKLKGPSEGASVTLGIERKQSWWVRGARALGKRGNREGKGPSHNHNSDP